MTPVQCFRDVIDRWPDMAACARDLDVSAASIRKWKERNSIPSEHWAALIRAAKERGFPEITADLLVQLADRQAA